ncbi:MAG: hypothetical protein EHM23_21320 [Acidobacteria bacterium]|nr:MAG: hypothetical protein EHM23_21320 [Acidobacteriota bacterium]
MGNPAFLLCDTDALIQIYLTQRSDLLEYLRRSFSVQPAVVPEVEIEIRNNGQYGRRFEPVFLRGMQSGQMVVLDDVRVCTFLSSKGIVDPETVFYRVLAEGNVNSSHVQRGEAFSHALASSLGLPLMSNDGDALRVLARLNRPLAIPTIRFMDLVVFAFGQGVIRENDCQSIVRILRGAHEYVPRAFIPGVGGFAHCSQSFSCRLAEAESGQQITEPQQPHHTLYLTIP